MKIINVKPSSSSRTQSVETNKNLKNISFSRHNSVFETIASDFDVVPAALSRFNYIKEKLGTDMH